MRDHLRPEEFVDALDDALAPARRAHVAQCQQCQAELADLRSVVADAGSVEPAAPSPLFWDHFSERVRHATSAESMPSAAPWWSAWWRPAGALVGAIGAVALFMFVQPAPSISSDAPVRAEYAELQPMADDGSWGLVVDMASELDASDVRDVVAPADGTIDSVMEELTPAQRAALVRLLQKEMGDL